MVVCYLVLIEVGKRIFYRAAASPRRPRGPHTQRRHLRRRAAYFSPGPRAGARPSPAPTGPRNKRP